MAMTLEEVSNILTEIDFKHQIEDKQIISLGGSDDHTLVFVIDLPEDGEMFQIEGRIVSEDNKVVNAKDSEHIAVLMGYLLQRNFETKFGTWELNPETGSMRIMVEIPLEDNKLTQAQLKRIVNMMVGNSDEAAAIKSILKTGKIPEDTSLSKEEMRAKLLEMLAKLDEPSDEDGI